MVRNRRKWEEEEERRKKRDYEAGNVQLGS